jgi:hypothetical protein
MEKDGKQRRAVTVVDGVSFPFSGYDSLTVDRQKLVQLGTVEIDKALFLRLEIGQAE